MRGAIIMDMDSGTRLEPDADRGVRVSRFDWSDAASQALDKELMKLGLTHFRTKEALALATKVAHAPGMIAELCWSDEPNYVAGYVASSASGYIRFPQMKEPGNRIGGRTFFIKSNRVTMDALLTYLQNTPVIITSVGNCSAADQTPKES